MLDLTHCNDLPLPVTPAMLPDIISCTACGTAIEWKVQKIHEHKQLAVLICQVHVVQNWPLEGVMLGYECCFCFLLYKGFGLVFSFPKEYFVVALLLTEVDF